MRRLPLHNNPLGQLTKNPRAILVLAEDLDLGRRLAQTLGYPGSRFTVARPHEMLTFLGESATFDLVLLHVGRERPEGALLREILGKEEGYVVVLSRTAIGVERAAWIEHGAEDWKAV